MRFLPSNPGRTAAEVLLTVAIVAFVVYDLSGRSSSVKPEASSVELSFEAKRPSALPATEAAVAPSSRFSAAAVSGISSANTFSVCGNYAAAANPWVIGGTTNQAVEISLGNLCTCSPAIQSSNSTANATSALAGVSVQSGSYLSFLNVMSQQSGCGATSGLLQMASGSTLLTSLYSPQTFNPFANLVFPLLLASGPCPTFTGVTIPATTNCPSTDLSYAPTGYYSCAVSYATVTLSGNLYCALLLTVKGALTEASAPFTMTFNKDCSTFTPVMFKATVASTTGVAAAAVDIIAWQCSSITVTFRILGSSAAAIAAAVSAISAAAQPGGALYNALGGITLGGVGTIVTTTTIRNNRGYYPVPYCRYYPCPSTIPFNPSTSNPGLFALLTLLVIPVFIFVGLLIYACLPRAPVCEPVPLCPPAPVCPAPAPVVYYAEPCAMPCADPCMAPAAPMGCF